MPGLCPDTLGSLCQQQLYQPISKLTPYIKKNPENKYFLGVLINYNIFEDFQTATQHWAFPCKSYQWYLEEGWCWLCFTLVLCLTELHVIFNLFFWLWFCMKIICLTLILIVLCFSLYGIPYNYCFERCYMNKDIRIIIIIIIILIILLLFVTHTAETREREREMSLRDSSCWLWVIVVNHSRTGHREHMGGIPVGRWTVKKKSIKS